MTVARAIVRTRLPLRSPLAVVAIGAVVAQPFWTLFPSLRHVSPGSPVGLLDVLLVALVVLTVDDWRTSAGAGVADTSVRLAGALAALCLVALVVHPSLAGVLATSRLCGAVCLWMALRRMVGWEARRLLVGSLVAIGIFQAFVAFVQIVSGRPFGARVLTGAWWPMNIVGGLDVPRGTFQHQFPLAAFSLLVVFAGLALLPSLPRRHRSASLVALSIAATPVGLTFSRSAVLGLVLGLAATVLFLRPVTTAAALGVAAILLGVLAPALVWRAGWDDRVTTSASAVTSGNADTFSSRRLHLARGALEIAHANPVFGIGPGRYVPGAPIAVKAAPKFPEEIVHDLPLFFAVEDGIPAGVLTLVILLGVARTAFRRRGPAAALFVCVLPYVLLDRLMYDGAHGLAFTAVWLALVEILAVPAPCDST